MLSFSLDYFQKKLNYIIGIIIVLLYYLISQVLIDKYIISDLSILLGPIVIAIPGAFFIRRNQSDELKIKDATSIFRFNIILSIGIIIISTYLSSLIVDPNMELYQQAMQSLNPLTLILSSIIFSPIAEEILFRGIIYYIGKKLTNNILYSAIISSIIFGAVHGTIVHMIPATIMGIFFCLVYEYSENIIYPIMCHTLYNIISLIIGSILCINEISSIGVSIIVCCVVFICYYMYIVFYALPDLNKKSLYFRKKI